MSPKTMRILFFWLLLITDAVISFCIILIAYEIRVSPITAQAHMPPMSSYIQLGYIFAFLNLYFMYVFGMYKDTRGRSGIDELFGVLKSVTVCLLLILALSFFYRDFSYSRLVLAYTFILAYFLLGTSRYVLIRIERSLLRAGYGRRKLLIVGTGGHFDALVKKITEKPEIGYMILGYIEEKPSHTLAPIPLLGALQEVEKLVDTYSPDEIIVTLDESHHEWVSRIVDICDRRGIDCKLSPNMVELMVRPRTFDEMSGVPLIRLKGLRIRGIDYMMKRILDIFLSSLLLVVLAPLFILITILIKLDSSGPIFYMQKRLGMDGVEYWMYKFRSMRAEAEARTPSWSKDDDPRITRVGRLMRKLSLDELPQIINVLQGTMSLVGPRPERPFFVEKFEKGIPRYLERHKVKAGITGWAQVNGLRGDTSIEERIQYDLYYIENWSLAFDIKILILTVLTILSDAFRFISRAPESVED
ncbi:MAG: undecaprenyl-phosphate glucose phosphotransferase [bacterium]